MRNLQWLTMSLGLITALGVTDFGAFEAKAAIPAKIPSGLGQKWMGSPRLLLAGNPSNQSNLSSDSVFKAVVRGLERWKAASQGVVQFEYWQGTDSSLYEANSDYNGLNSVYFLSQNAGENLDSRVLGQTQVWYDPTNGQVLETDIVLNDVNYSFTTSVTDTTSKGGKKVFIESVLTHELGHALGLSHSGSMQATMLYVEGPEQFSLSCDDQTGIRALYPSGANGSFDPGAISGQITAPDGAPLFGATVSAVSVSRGEVLASALTDSNGIYTLGGLEAGSYVLSLEPYFGGGGSLSGSDSAINPYVCGSGSTAQAFRRAVVPGTVNVTPGQTNTVSAITASCTGPFQPASGTLLISGDELAISAQVDSTHELRVNWDAPGTVLHFRVLSYSLYSALKPKVSVLDASGTPLSVTVKNPAFVGSSGFTNWDVEVTGNVPSGPITLVVGRAGTLYGSYFPGGYGPVDPSSFALVVGRRAGTASELSVGSPGYSTGARCQIDESTFASYQSPAGDPARSSVGTPKVGFCGTVRAISEIPVPGSKGRGTGGEIPTPVVIGWFLPILLPHFAWALTLWRRPKRAC